MSLFSNQPLFCSNCGKGFEKAGFDHHHWITCSIECYRDLNWKYTLSVMGKAYYPRRRPFMEKLQSGEKPDIDQEIEDWHTSTSQLTLREYLGMTEYEYKRFVETAQVVESR